MSHTEEVQQAIEKHSKANIDEYIQASSFKPDLQDVSSTVPVQTKNAAATCN